MYKCVKPRKRWSNVSQFYYISGIHSVLSQLGGSYTFFHMYSHKDGFFPGIFPAGDLARGAHLRWRSVSMPPPIGRLWRDTQSGVQAAPWRQGGAEWDPTMGMGMGFYDCFYESQKFNIVQWW
jgi:hypothetical protein